VTAKVTVKDLKRASFVLAYEIYKENGDLGVTAEIELVCARNNIAHPVALPPEYREKLS
jgi:acyl-CoA thioesterase FadM